LVESAGPAGVAPEQGLQVPQMTEGQPTLVESAEGQVPRAYGGQPTLVESAVGLVPRRYEGQPRSAEGLVPRAYGGQPRTAEGLVPRRYEGQPRAAEGLAPPEEGTRGKVAAAAGESTPEQPRTGPGISPGGVAGEAFKQHSALGFGFQGGCSASGVAVEAVKLHRTRGFASKQLQRVRSRSGGLQAAQRA
jgi:hypothetical protein